MLKPINKTEKLYQALHLILNGQGHDILLLTEFILGETHRTKLDQLDLKHNKELTSALKEIKNTLIKMGH